jgi:hypothetical protein
MSLARLAADIAMQTAALEGENPVMAYAHILRDGGRVLRREAPGRYAISLGRYAGAGEGQRFAVQDEKGRDMAELIVVDVRERESLTELMLVADPARQPEVGDRLTLLEDGKDVSGMVNAWHAGDDGAQLGADAGAAVAEHLSLGAFFRQVAAAQESCGAFVLAIVRMDDAGLSSQALAAWRRHLGALDGSLAGE